MRYLKAILLLLIIPLSGKCDFSDYWTVSLNDSLVYDSRTDKNSYEEVYRLNLTEFEIGADDTLTIIYRTDTPCPDCEYNLLLTDPEKNKKLLLKQQGSAVFNLTGQDLTEIDGSTLTEVIYFRSDQNYLKEILKFEKH